MLHTVGVHDLCCAQFVAAHSLLATHTWLVCSIQFVYSTQFVRWSSTHAVLAVNIPADDSGQLATMLNAA